MTDWITSGTWQLGEMEKARLEAALKVVNPYHVLDIGCRDGTFALTLAREHPDYFIHAFDTDASAIEWANRKAIELNLENATFWNDNLLDPKLIPFGKFDTVYLMETLEHLPPDRIQQGYDTALKFLKPGGRLVVSVPANTHISDPDHHTVFYREAIHGQVRGAKWVSDCPFLWIMFRVDVPGETSG